MLAAAKSNQKNTTVLLIDKDPQIQLKFNNILSDKHQNYRLIWCQNFEQALEVVEFEGCHVVLLDYHLKGNGQGYQLIAKVKEKNRSIPIIALTDAFEEDIDHRIIAEGAADYLVKSYIDADRLERSIRYARDRKEIEGRLDYLAHYDHLTKLPNRTLFSDRLEQSIHFSVREDLEFALKYVDVNEFKAINDHYGHHVGDKILQQFATRLRDTLRRSDTVARIGGDEFTVILQNIGSSSHIMNLAQKIIDEISEPFIIEHHILNVGCSIGIALYPDSGEDAESLQNHADFAMLQAKKEKQSAYCFHSESASRTSIKAS